MYNNIQYGNVSIRVKYRINIGGCSIRVYRSFNNIIITQTLLIMLALCLMLLATYYA